MWRAEAQELKNLVRTRDGRLALLGTSVLLVCLALGGLALAEPTLLSAEAVALVEEDATGEMARWFYALALLFPLLAQVSVGPGGLHKTLYASPSLPLLLSAPVTSFRLVLRCFGRALVDRLVFCFAIGGPWVLKLGEQSHLSAAPALVFPLALLLLAAPLVAAQMLLKVSVVRWCSGARARRWLALLHVLTVTAGILLLVAGFVTQEEVSAALVKWLESGVTLPWLLKGPASLLAAATGHELAAGAASSLAFLLLCPIPLLALTAFLYRASVEAFWTAEILPSGRARRAVARSWPDSPIASFLAKDWRATVRVRSNLVAVVVFVGMTVLALELDLLADPNRILPEPLEKAFATLLAWQASAMLVAMLAFLGVLGDEQKQITLLAASPVSRRQLLIAKMTGVAGLFLACVLAAALASPFVAQATLPSVGLFVLMSAPILALLLGWITFIGTCPAFLPIHRDVPLSHQMTSIIPSLLVSGGAVLCLWGTVKLKGALTASFLGKGVFRSLTPSTAGGLMLAAVWLAAVAVLWAALILAERNLERLLGPQPE